MWYVMPKSKYHVSVDAVIPVVERTHARHPLAVRLQGSPLSSENLRSETTQPKQPLKLEHHVRTTNRRLTRRGYAAYPQ